MSVTKERLCRKVKLATPYDGFKVEYGTFNRNNPEVIYVSINTWIKPLISDFSHIANNLNKTARVVNSEFLTKNETPFVGNITTTKLASTRMASDKKSFLSFEIHLKQNKYDRVVDPLLKEEVSKLANNLIGGVVNRSNGVLEFSGSKK